MERLEGDNHPAGTADVHAGMPRVSVVLVNYNGRTFLPAALAALQQNTTELDTEIIIVDSASTDGGIDELDVSGRLEVRIVRCAENVGFCRGANLGVEQARGELVVFAQVDGEMLPGWDPPLRRALDDLSVVGAGGIVFRMDGEAIDSAGMAIAPNIAGWSLCEGLTRAQAGLDDGVAREIMGVSPALLMVRRANHLRMGGFWEKLFMYGDEADYAMRLARLGKVMLCPNSGMLHWSGGASGPHQSPLRLYWSSRNRLLNAARHLPLLRMLWAVLLSAGFDGLQMVQQRTGAGCKAVIKGWLAGLWGMPGARRTSSVEERTQDVRCLSTLGEALAQQRSLGRLRVNHEPPPWGRKPDSQASGTSS